MKTVLGMLKAGIVIDAVAKEFNLSVAEVTCILHEASYTKVSSVIPNNLSKEDLCRKIVAKLGTDNWQLFMPANRATLCNLLIGLHSATVLDVPKGKKADIVADISLKLNQDVSGLIACTKIALEAIYKVS